MATSRLDEPDCVADDASTISYREARVMWENGEFSEWVEQHGFPLTINGTDYSSWQGVEEALSDDTWDD